MIDKIIAFLFPDFKVVKVLQAPWIVSQSYDGVYSHDFSATSIYEFMYSERRKQWKLRSRGFKWDQHDMYPKCVSALQYLQSGKMTREQLISAK